MPVSYTHLDSYAFSVNEILKDMLGYYMRPAKIEDLIEEFEYGMDRDEYDKAKCAMVEKKARRMAPGYCAVMQQEKM